MSSERRGVLVCSEPCSHPFLFLSIQILMMKVILPYDMLFKVKDGTRMNKKREESLNRMKETRKEKWITNGVKDEWEQVTILLPLTIHLRDEEISQREREEKSGVIMK